MKKLSIPILIVFLAVVMGGSYFIFQQNHVSSFTINMLTLAIIFLAPLSIYFLWIRPRSLPKLLTYISFILCLGTAYAMIPSVHKGFLHWILVWLLPVLEISIIIIVVFSIIKSVIHYKRMHANKQNHVLALIRNALEPKLGRGFLLEAVLTELSVLYYSLFIWLTRPSMATPGTYTYHKTSQIKTIVILFSILIAVEGAFFHYLIQTWSTIFAWIFTILNIYALLYIVGLYNAVRYSPHIITQNKLIICFGYQSSIELDMANIKCIKRARESGFGVKVPRDTYISLLKIDAPQYEIFLKEPAVMKGSYGMRKHVQSVVFRADEPTKMLEAINNMRSEDASEVK